ncbi:PqiC family protein [Pigmentiphaga soli]|uniref:PqiC family protein n=1 Tax=Pigmentiphaga soli TaxID=1007095 RepID=A0ABP8GCC3_9BURK
MKIPAAPHAAAAVLAALALAGCASPEPPRIYTLQADAPASAAGAGRSATSAAAPGATAIPVPDAGAAPAFVDIAPVVVPERMRRRQIMLRDDAARLRVLEQDRWAASLPDELHDAIAAGLKARYGMVDVSQTGLAGGRPVYRISIEFSALDAREGGDVSAAVAWSVRPLADTRAGLVCHLDLGVPAGDTIGAVVAAHQRLVGELVDALAASRRAAEQGGAAPSWAAG